MVREKYFSGAFLLKMAKNRFFGQKASCKPRAQAIAPQTLKFRVSPRLTLQNSMFFFENLKWPLLLKIAHKQFDGQNCVLNPHVMHTIG